MQESKNELKYALKACRHFKVKHQEDAMARALQEHEKLLAQC